MPCAVQKEIVDVQVGNYMSVGVDSNRELHMWGKKEYTNIPDK